MPDQVSDIITTWDTNDELSNHEEDAVPQLLSSNSPAADSAIISREISDENEADNESTTSAQDATAGNIAGRNGAIRTFCQPVLTDRTPVHSIFTATPGIPSCALSSIRTRHSARQMSIRESILRPIAKFTTEKAVHRGDIDFSRSLDELESFIALQYVRGLYGKNHPVVVL